MRGFLIGIIWGAVVAVLTAAGLSLAIGLPDAPEAKAPAATEPVTDEQVAVADPESLADNAITKADPAGTGAAMTTKDEETLAEPSSAVSAPQTDGVQPGRRPVAESGVSRPAEPAADLTAPAVPRDVGVDTTPPKAPEVGTVPAVPEALPSDSGSLRVEVGTDAPVLPGAQSDAPGAPAPDTGPVVSTDPAQPPAPPLPEAETALLADPVIETVEDESPAAPTGDDDGAVVAEPVTEPADEDTAEPVAEDTPVVVAEPPAQPATETEADTAGPAIGRPAGSLINRPSAVAEGRLPRIGTTAQDGTGSDASASQNAAGSLPATSPVVRFAVPSDAVAGEPRISIVLIDSGDTPLGPSMLDGFPFPLTIAIDPSHPSARETAAAYRAAGVEVMALASLPEGAQPSDVEVTLAGTLEAVPEAIGILESPESGIQGSRQVSAQVTSFLVSSGHGLLTQPKGLNTAQQLAAREGVPSATVFRDFDGKGQNADAMRRFLQNGVVRARQEGAVVMMGRLKADTITALIQWGLQDSNEGLALVPASVILREAIAE